MEVAYYQIFIFSTICLTGLFKPRLLLWVCLGWSAFTIVNLFYPPLIFIQLLVVWAGYALFKTRAKTARILFQKNEEVERLQGVISGLGSQEQEDVRRVDPTGLSPIATKDHWPFLLEAIRASTRELVIVSGWLDNRVIGDRAFLKEFEAALARGVKVYVGFGWKSFDGAHRSGAGLERALSKLRRLSRRYEGQLFVADYPNHSKIVTVDGARMAIGSANWLSNRNYSNEEDSLLVSDKDLSGRYARSLVERIGKADSAL